MFDTRVRRPTTPRWRCGPVLARERGPGYDPEPPPRLDPADEAVGPAPGSPLAEALAHVAGAQAALARVDLAEEHITTVTEATLALQRLRNRLDASLLDLLRQVDAREGYRADGAVTCASWLRARTRLDPGAAATLVHAARRLEGLPLLAGRLAAGDVTLAHVTAVTRAAIPQRAAAIAAHDAILAQLAVLARPFEMRRAVAKIAELHDPDGGDDPPPPVTDPHGRDTRRELTLREGLDSLGELQATLDAITAEGLRVLLDALDEPDPPETPAEQRRSPAQRRHDAFAELIRRMLALPDTPTVHGYRPAITAIADLARLHEQGIDPATLARLAGLDGDVLATADAAAAEGDPGAGPGGDIADPAQDSADPATGTATGPPGTTSPRAPASSSEEVPDVDDPAGVAARLLRGPVPPVLRFGSGIPIPTSDLPRLLAGGATVLAVLTLGPWRVVNVGARHRTLPAWLRQALLALHLRCRGPDCDRPAAWTQAHHATDWSNTHVTDLNDSIPLCLAHHQLCTDHGWTARLDLTTGHVVWTTPTGRAIVVPPPTR